MTRLPAAQRKEQLLDRAAELFSTQGYARSTTKQLAQSAGVTEPIIYRHFKSKRNLFIALIERTGRETLEQWEKDLEGADDPAERLRRLIGDNPMVTERGRNQYRVFLQAITEVEDEQIQKAVGDHITRLHAFIRREVERAQVSHKVTSKISAELLGWLLVHIGMGYGVLTAMGIPDHGTDSMGGHVQQVISRLLVGPGDNVREPGSMLEPGAGVEAGTGTRSESGSTSGTGSADSGGRGPGGGA